MCEQEASGVLYYFASCVHDQILHYIRDAKMLKEARENLGRIFAARTTARKLQVRQELNSIRQRVMSITVKSSMRKLYERKNTENRQGKQV